MTDLISRRRKVMGPNVPTFYDEPVHLVKGDGVWLWDKAGKKYLDCYNNVAHVGHCHPKVVQAIADQAATLNTHTRYLHEGILDYSERLVAKFADHLSTAVMVCTGSEANDLALRMAQAVTGKTGIIATDNTYHGNTALVTQVSSRKPPIGGYASNIRRVADPEGTATSYSAVDPNEAQRFADDVARSIQELEDEGCGFSCLILCPYFANEGFPNLPKGFLDKTAEVVRKAGGLIIADEVQPGFGRVGEWWGHEKIGLKPDIVTLGKPMANGHPVAAVVTSENTISAFRNAFSYFNTFGGNPVAAAAAMATLDIVEQEDLPAHAAKVGAYALERLTELTGRHDCLGVARGSGLFFGAEVIDAKGNPNPELSLKIPEGMRENGVLMNLIGRHRSVLKIRPPMPIQRDEIDILMDTLDGVLESL